MPGLRLYSCEIFASLAFRKTTLCRFLGYILARFVIMWSQKNDTMSGVRLYFFEMFANLASKNDIMPDITLYSCENFANVAL